MHRNKEEIKIKFKTRYLLHVDILRWHCQTERENNSKEILLTKKFQATIFFLLKLHDFRINIILCEE